MKPQAAHGEPACALVSTHPRGVRAGLLPKPARECRQQPSRNRWEQCRCHGIVRGREKEQTIDNNPEESPGKYAEEKEPVPKGYLLGGSIYRTLLKGQNYTNGEYPSGRPGWRRGWGRSGV